MHHKLQSNTVLTSQSCGISEKRKRSLLYAPHIALYHGSHITELCSYMITVAEGSLCSTYCNQHRSHVTELCCKVITEAETSTIRLILHSNTVLTLQSCAVK
jgi:hypothetical protein